MTAPASAVSQDQVGQLVQSMQKHRGEFSCANAFWAYGFDPIPTMNTTNPSQWKQIPLEIDASGQLKAHGDVSIAQHIQKCTVQLYERHLVIKVTISSQKVLFFKMPTYQIYRDLLGCLACWQNLEPEGIDNKWNFATSIVHDETKHANDLLVCRFKVFGPLPKKKAVVPQNGYANPIFPSSAHTGAPPEGWFIAIGHLMPNGMLNILDEKDGTLLYVVNVAALLSSEVREVHHSVLQSSNVLFLGVIDDLRRMHSALDTFNTNGQFLKAGKACGHDDKKLAGIERILIDFDLRIDLADWIVALSSFTGLEYVGNDLCHKQIRAVRNLTLEVMEATFTNPPKQPANIYCEMRLWNAPWFRTSVAQFNQAGVFWKESVEMTVPPGVKYFKILIHSAQSPVDYCNGDDVVGTCFVTPDLFNENQYMTKLPIYDPNNRSLGNLTINLTLEETHVLPYKNYKLLENMLLNMKLNEMVEFVSPITTPSTLEGISTTMLDVFQSLHREDEFFEVLMNHELAPFDVTKRSSKGKSKNATSMNTLFRGNSMLSKSLEKFDIRVGQEYLEKLIGPFICTIVRENLNCDCDPKTCPTGYQANYRNLLKYLEILWHNLFTTSNDLPREMKLEWKRLRSNVELAVEPSDTDTPLNALSAFVFLRFLCPAILNPQLFNLTQGHYSLNSSRTLTAIAKVMMVFANRSKFQPHKDPSLIQLNTDFIDKHSSEILTYYDRITGRKMDFNEKVLDLSSSKDRVLLNASKEVLSDLPSTPYLIDKYLSLSKLAQLLYDNGGKQRMAKKKTEKQQAKKEMLTVGDTDFFGEDFLSNMMDDNNEEFNNILFKRDFSMNEVSEQSAEVISTMKALEQELELPEVPAVFTEKGWKLFTKRCASAARLGKDNMLVYDAYAFRDPTEDSQLENFLEKLASHRTSASPLTSTEGGAAANGGDPAANGARTSGGRHGRSQSTASTSASSKAGSSKETTPRRKGVFKNLFRRKGSEA